jgi:hypothetical protein
MKPTVYDVLTIEKEPIAKRCILHKHLDLTHLIAASEHGAAVSKSVLTMLRLFGRSLESMSLRSSITTISSSLYRKPSSVS